MSQNDFTIANQGFPAFRADLNSALQALASNSSGATAPSTTFANMWWYDSANNIMYIRNEDNDAWIKFAELDQTNDKFVLSGTLQLDDGTVSAPALTFNSDTNMGIYRGGTDILKFVTAGTDAITIDASQGVTLAGKLDVSSGTIKLDGNYPVGTGNVALGDNALNGSMTGNYDVAVGQSSLASITSGSYNSAFGQGTLAVTTSGSYNTAVGTNSLNSNTQSNYNTALGSNALALHSSHTVNADSYMVAVGHDTLDANTTGVRSTAIGALSLGTNTTGNDNTAVGFQALHLNVTGSQNTAVGYQAGYSTTGTGNTFIGCTSGSVGAGYFVTTGSKNTIIGGFHGNQNGLDIRTSNNYIVLSDGDGNPRGYFNSAGVWTISNSGTGQYQSFINSSATSGNIYGEIVTFGYAPNNTVSSFYAGNDTVNTKFNIYSNGSIYNQTGTFAAFSDVKLKQDIQDAGSAWDDIKAVRVRKYRLKADVEANSDAKPLLGVIAQELEITSPNLIDETKDIKVVDGKEVDTGEYTKGVKYSILYMKAVKALQEAMERIETLEAKVTALENA